MPRTRSVACLLGALFLAVAVSCSSAADPEPTTTLTPAPTEDPAAEEAAYAEETMALVAERVEALRGLDGGDGPADTTLLTEEDLAALIDELLAQPDWSEALDHDQALYSLLGLIEPDTDLTAITREVAIAGIAGLYRPDIDHLYVRLFGSFSALEEATASHEYQHYLQDRHYNLEVMLDGASRDTILAVRALVEGEATYIQNQYVAAHFNTAQSFSMGFGGALAAVEAPTVPAVLVRETQFVYLEGSNFVFTMVGTHGGRRADELFNAPPQSTEQILHPGKYLTGELAVDVRSAVLDLSIPLPWTVETTDVLGEFMLDVWLREIGAGSDAEDAAAGWGGDAYQVLSTPDGTRALLAIIEWDRARDQKEFLEVATAALDRGNVALDCSPCNFAAWNGPAGAIALAEGASDDRSWTILVIAPTAQDLASLVAATR